MADLADTVDITQDLNGQGSDAVPYHGNDVPQGGQPAQTVGAPPAKPAEGEAAKPEPTIRDLLSDAFKGQQAPVQPDAKAPPAEGAAAPVDAPALVKVGDRFHRPDGSFASKEDIEAFTRAQAAPGEKPPAADLPAWTQQLTALEREQFTKLPAETRQFVERTMEGVARQSSQYQEYGMLEQVISPRRQLWAQEGLTPAVALNQLLALSDFAGRDPSEFVLWFADTNKLDLDAILDARDAANAGGQANPALLGLQQEIAQLRNALGGFTNQTVQQQHAQNFQAVQKFVDEKDEAGKALHPYFNELSTEIGQHVAAIRQQQPYLPERDLLQAAYDFAAYNNPVIRDRMQQENAKAMQERAASEAARARQVGVSINGGPAGDTSQLPNNASRTLREELVHAYQQQQAGV